MKKSSIVVPGTLLIAALAANLLVGPREEKTKTPTLEQGIGGVYADENRREYAGNIRIFPSGAERKIYLDYKPFGNLDAVKTELCSRGGYVSHLPTRKPETNEEDTFSLLQYLTFSRHVF